MTYYIKGGSRYNAANPKVWTALFLGGYNENLYATTWENLADKGVETDKDPYWRFGSSSGGEQTAEFGLYNDYRIEIDQANGIRGWNGSQWIDILAGVGGGNLGDLGDVVIDSPADNEVLAYNNATSTWINQTPAEAGLEPAFGKNSAFNKNFGTGGTEVCVGNDARLSDARTPTAHVLATTGPHTGTLPWTDLNKTGSNLTDLVTRNHNDLLNINLGDDYEHITQAQKDELHVINPHTFTEIAEPATPAATKLLIWAEESQGHTVLRFSESSGAHIHTIGECMHVIGRNTSGAEIAKGKMVYYNGTTTGKHPNFSMAKADALATMPCIGITTEVVANNGYGKIMTMGRLVGLNTDAFLAGGELYVSGTVAGGITKTFPPSPLIDQHIGVVEVKHATNGIILIDIHTSHALSDGTIRMSFSIGDGASGDVTLGFNGDAGNDGSIVYDVSEDTFNLNRQLNMNTKKIIGVVDPTGDQDAATKKFHNDNKTVAGDLNLNDLAEKNHVSLAGILANQHHVAFVQGDADALYSILAHLHDDRYYTETEVDDRVFEKAAIFPVAPSEGDLHYDTVDEALYRYSGDALNWVQIGAAGIGGDIYVRSGIASDDLVFSNDTERTTMSAFYVKIKEIAIYRNLNLKVYWSAVALGLPDTCYSKVYINGIAVGSQRINNTMGWADYTEDYEMNVGDLLQIYAYRTGPGGTPVRVKDMRLKFIEYVSNDP